MRFFFQAEDGIRDLTVTGVQTCALPICHRRPTPPFWQSALVDYYVVPVSFQHVLRHDLAKPEDKEHISGRGPLRFMQAHHLMAGVCQILGPARDRCVFPTSSVGQNRNSHRVATWPKASSVIGSLSVPKVVAWTL